MAGKQEREVPEGVGVFPLIPPELGVHPLLLGVLHAMVFLSASEDEVVNPEAADEAFVYIAGYLQRLSGPELERVRADLECLVDFARREKWTRDEIEFLEKFLADCGVGGEGEA